MVMLGSQCSPCCGGCQCESGTPPETVTVTFEGLENTVQGPWLVSLTFVADWGSGAAGHVTEPGGGSPGSVTAVDLTSGGSGYAVFGREEPTLTISAVSGSGLQVDWTFATNNPTALVTYTATAGDVTAGGSGYTDGDTVTMNGSTTITEGSSTIRTVRDTPLGSLVVYGTGEGASLSPSWTQGADANSRPVFSVTGITITDGGTGYTDDDPVYFDVSDGTWTATLSATVTADEDGVITGVTITNGGSYYRDTGVVESVEIVNGGEHYHEDASLPPIVADVTVVLNQSLGSGTGTGATITATVDEDTSSNTFGQITDVEITNGGSGYLAWAWVTGTCCETWYQGRSFVLQKAFGEECCYIRAGCGYKVSASISPVSANVGQSLTGCPSESLAACGSYATASEPVGDCDSFSFSLTGARGVTATFSAGGEYVAPEWPVCPASATVSFRGTDFGGDRIDPEITGLASGYAWHAYGDTSIAFQYMTCRDDVGSGAATLIETAFTATGTGMGIAEDAVAVAVVHTCPCRYYATVSIGEDIAESGAYVCRRVSVWESEEVESVDVAWPAAGTMTWRLLSVQIFFYDNGVQVNTFWEFTATQTIDDYSVASQAQFANLKSWSGLGDDYAEPGDPDMTWSIEWEAEWVR